MVDRKSTIPKKLKMYLVGFFIQNSLKMYSIVNKMVTTHSEISKKAWYFSSYLGTLSSITTTTLYTMTNNKIMSNAFPAGVWVP